MKHVRPIILCLLIQVPLLVSGADGTVAPAPVAVLRGTPATGAPYVAATPHVHGVVRIHVSELTQHLVHPWRPKLRMSALAWVSALRSGAGRSGSQEN